MRARIAALLVLSWLSGCVCDQIKARPLAADGSCWDEPEEIECGEPNKVTPHEVYTARDEDGRCWLITGQRRGGCEPMTAPT